MKQSLKIRDVESEEPLEVVSTDFLKITPHLNAKGQKVAGKWDLVEGAVYGELRNMKRLESAQGLTVVRGRYELEMWKRGKRGPAGWPK